MQHISQKTRSLPGCLDDPLDPRRIREMMRRQQVGQEQAVELLLAEYEAAKLAAVDYWQKVWAPVQIPDVSNLPDTLDEAAQAALPEWLSRFRAYAMPGDNRQAEEQRRAAIQAAWRWVRQTALGQVSGLYLYSTKPDKPRDNVTGYGCGKTHLAGAAIQLLQGAGVKAVYITADALIDKIKRTYHKDSLTHEMDLIREWTSGPLLIDDFGKEYVKDESQDWYVNIFFKILDRLAGTNYQRKSLLITSNISPKNLSGWIGEAATSRLIGAVGLSGFVDMSAIPDYRRKGT